MAYKSDHEFRGKLWTQVIRGLPKDLKRSDNDRAGYRKQIAAREWD